MLVGLNQARQQEKRKRARAAPEGDTSEIERRKAKFAQKKARRLERKAAAVADACARAGRMVLLDNHMSDGDWCCSLTDQNGLWYNDRWPES